MILASTCQPRIQIVSWGASQVCHWVANLTRHFTTHLPIQLHHLNVVLNIQTHYLFSVCILGSTSQRDRLVHVSGTEWCSNRSKIAWNLVPARPWNVPFRVIFQVYDSISLVQVDSSRTIPLWLSISCNWRIIRARTRIVSRVIDCDNSIDTLLVDWFFHSRNTGILFSWLYILSCGRDAIWIPILAWAGRLRFNSYMRLTVNSAQNAKLVSIGPTSAILDCVRAGARNVTIVRNSLLVVDTVVAGPSTAKRENFTPRFVVKITGQFICAWVWRFCQFSS